jgi:TolB protein
MRRILAAAAAVLSLSLVTSCGNGGNGGSGGGGKKAAVGANPNGIEKEGSGAALKTAIAALRGAPTVHVTIRMRDSTTVDYHNSGKDFVGRLSARGRTADYIIAFGKLYVKGDPGVLLRFRVAPAAALHAADRWVSAPPALLQGMTVDFFASFFEADDNPVRPGVGTQDLHGVPVAVLTRLDGSKIYAARTGTPYPLRVVDSTGDVYEFADFGAPFTARAPVGAVDPATLPPVGTIVYTSLQHGSTNLWAVNPDGAGRRQISHFIASDPSRPALSPDGSQIAFQRQEYGNDDDADIWLINSDGTGARNLTPSVAVDRSPTWSADGAKITFTSNRAGGGHYELFEMNPDGSQIRQITHRGHTATDPAYSLDGGGLAFLDCQPNFTGCRLWGGAADGGPHQLSGLAASVERPAWSPDGTKIAFTTPAPDDGGDIVVMNDDGSGQRTLTSNHNSIQPAWSPDGSTIVFTDTEHGIDTLYAISPGGGARHKISSEEGLGTDKEPTWQR